MHFTIVTLFPEFFDSPLRAALFGKATESGVVTYSLRNPRDYATDRHHTVDDRPYGGGPGMVMMLPPLLAALRAVAGEAGPGAEPGAGPDAGPDATGQGAESPSTADAGPGTGTGRILVMAPGGRPLTQSYARELALESRLTLVCGRYEGIDARLGDILPVEYVSVGEAVCNGGEAPALMLMEAVARLVPGFMGKEDSGTEESFSQGLLEYPHYTRPEVCEGHTVPDVLRGGDHGRVAAWRRGESLLATLRTRPDMLDDAPLNGVDAALLSESPRTRLGKNCFVALAHYPVVIEGKNSGASSLTNLDIHDIARISRTYGLGGMYVTTPIEDQRAVLDAILQHWLGPARAGNPDRADALETVRGVPLIEDAVADVAARTGRRPRLLATSARWPGKKGDAPCLTVADARTWLHQGPVLLILGTGHGLAPEQIAACDGVLRPLRGFDAYNHLSVRSAAAIVTDRILGDIF